MEKKESACPTCGRAFKSNKGFWVTVIGGGVMGFFVGLGFVYYWFGPDAGFTHFMALIHEVAGTALGLLGGWIVAYLRSK
ncbi:MAG: hypothetical protein KAT46_02990 [Deltaproteobacteria bacterium]|nr:hypothetical protein [Deltaproteobacteria bacterium]